MSQSPALDSPETTSPATEDTLISRQPNISAVLQNWGVIQIALLFAIISGAWILFSDRFVALLAPDPATLLTINTLAGWGFVIFTAAFLYGLIRRYTARLGHGTRMSRWLPAPRWLFSIDLE
jgi:hypothetical protein